MALFNVIDKADEAVGRSYAAARASADRLDALQSGYDTKYPEGLSKVTSWFGNKTRVADAPVKLPPWDPSTARIDVEGEASTLSSAVGVNAAVGEETLAAFMSANDEDEDEVGQENEGEENSKETGNDGDNAPPARIAPTLASGEDDEDDEEDDDEE